MKHFSSKTGSGLFVLMLSGVICKALGAFFRLPLTNLLGIEGIGVFQLVMSLYAFALVVTCGGVTASLSKLISSARAKGEHSKISVYLSRSIFVGLSVGLALGGLIAILSKQISAFQGVSSYQSYLLFLALLPLGALLASLRGFFQGYENMLPTAISQIFEQVFKFAFGLLFAFYFAKNGVASGVFGAFLGITLSEVGALVLLWIVFASRKNKVKSVDFGEKKLAKSAFDKANFPLMLSASIIPLVNAFDALIIVSRLSSAGFTSALATKLFGLATGVVGAVLNFPLIISVSVATAFLPNISYLLSRGSGGRAVIEKGLKILLFLILPTTFGMVAISRLVFSVLYADISQQLLDLAFQLMLYGGFSTVFTALMQYFLMLLQATGEFRFILITTFFAGILKAVLVFTLSAVQKINIFAITISNIALVCVVSIFALARLKKTVAFSCRFGEIFTIIFATFAMFLTVWTFVRCEYFSVILNLILGVLLGMFVYLALTLPVILKIFKNAKILKKSAKGV